MASEEALVHDLAEQIFQTVVLTIAKSIVLSAIANYSNQNREGENDRSGVAICDRLILVIHIFELPLIDLTIAKISN